MKGWTLAGLCAPLLVLSGCSCGDPTPTLAVDAKTDLVPGVEFATVRVSIDARGGRTRDVQHPARRGEGPAFRMGERVAELGGVSEGMHRLEVALRDASGGEVLSRTVVVEVHGNTIVTVVLTRDCRGTVCPGSGDETEATECLGGRCVDPRCSDGTDASVCVGGECAADSECTPVAPCATGVCDGASCLFFEIEGACAAAEYCDPDRGCTPLDAEGDAGPVDGGPDTGMTCDPSGCDDGVACTTDGCDAAGCVSTPDHSLCTDRVGGRCDPDTGCAYPCESRDDCSGGATCHEGACITATAYRVTRMALVAPRIWAYVGMSPFCSCAEATSTLNDGIGRDLEGASVPVYVFLPLDPSAGRNDLEGHDRATCPSATSCGPGSGDVFAAEAVHAEAGGACLSSPAGSADPPCFRAESPTLRLDVADTTLTVTDVEVAATFSGDRLVSGLLTGYVTVEAARAATVPSEVPLCGGNSLWDMLRGGGSCQPGDDREGSGWRVHFAFEATRVDWTG